VAELTSCEEEDAALEASVEWLHSAKLEYASTTTSPAPEAPTPAAAVGLTCSSKACSHGTGAPGGTELKKCSRCGGAWYCSRECQVADWKQGHKHACGRVKRFLQDPSTVNNRVACVRLLRRIRLYTGPFVVAHEAGAGGQPGQGFLLIQSPNAIQDFALLGTKVRGRSGFLGPARLWSREEHTGSVHDIEARALLKKKKPFLFLLFGEYQLDF
jgi:hypothetical protein